MFLGSRALYQDFSSFTPLCVRQISSMKGTLEHLLHLKYTSMLFVSKASQNKCETWKRYFPNIDITKQCCVLLHKTMGIFQPDLLSNFLSADRHHLPNVWMFK